MAHDLDELREHIRSIDDQILGLVAERLEAARAAGRQKREAGVPLRDWDVERTVLDRAAATAAELGLSPTTVRSLMQVLIAAARAEQERISYSTYQGSAESIAVVGGEGRMGRWFVDFFRNQGHQVSISDPAGPSSTPLEEATAGTSLALIATPPDTVPLVLDRLASSGYQGTAFDIASLKEHLRPAITSAAEAGLSVTSIHPMFGPDTRTLADHVICVCDCGDTRAAHRVRDLFRDTAATIVELSLEEHDRVILYVLGLSHLVNLLFAKVLMSGNTDFENLDRVGSTTFQAQVETASTVIGEDPGLYYMIQRLNPFTPELYEALRREFDELSGWVLDDDRERFTEMMMRGREWMSRSDHPAGE
jgi:chorismate mutase/prephenate dehydrogenase